MVLVQHSVLFLYTHMFIVCIIPFISISLIFINIKNSKVRISYAIFPIFGAISYLM